MSQDREPGRQWPDEAVLTGAAALDTHLADLVVYCRTVTGSDEDAVSAAHAVLDSAQSLLTDPDKLRAWLFALARVEILADSEPDAREMLDLVHRHGIRPEDLPVVVGIPPVSADQMLAAAEAEYDDVKYWDHRPGWDDSTHLIERQPDLTAVGSPGEMLDAELPNLVAYCSALADGEEEAMGTAQSVLGSSRSLLTDPDRLRAWLFALARQEMLADTAADAQEIFDLVHRYQIRAENLPAVLGIPHAEAAKLLATAEKEYFRGVLGAGQHEANSRESQDWQEDVGPKSHRLQDFYGLFRKLPESAGHQPAAIFSGGGLRQVLARGPAQAAAATAIVVAVIGGGAAYLAASSIGGRPSQAVPVTGHLP